MRRRTPPPMYISSPSASCFPSRSGTRGDACEAERGRRLVAEWHPLRPRERGRTGGPVASGVRRRRGRRSARACARAARAPPLPARAPGGGDAELGAGALERQLLRGPGRRSGARSLRARAVGAGLSASATAMPGTARSSSSSGPIPSSGTRSATAGSSSLPGGRSRLVTVRAAVWMRRSSSSRQIGGVGELSARSAAGRGRARARARRGRPGSPARGGAPARGSCATSWRSRGSPPAGSTRWHRWRT